jgi:peptide/nickel transport system ATP-binding protein
MAERLLDVKGLKTHFFTDEGIVRAVDGIDLHINKGETLGIVGESGCGKSTFAKVLLGLETATEGKAVLDNQDLSQVPVQKRRPQVVSHLQMVFQNPFDTLNPSHSVGGQISRVIRKFGVEKDPDKVRERVMQLLDIVKLPRDFYFRRPRQLSGGQKQRVGIARAFAGNPRVVVADEPVSALDVSVQAAVAQLLMEIQRENRTTLLFISHDLSLVRYLADRVIVMYLGTIAEQGTTDEVFAPPYHPYTEALLSAVPVPDPTVEQKRIRLEGEIPSPLNVPKGCRFAGRCPRKLGAICDEQPPPEQQAGPDHRIACHIPLDVLRRVEPIFDMR